MPSSNTRHSAGAQESRKAKTKTQIAFERRQAWIDHQRSDPALSLTERLIAIALGWHKNLKTGQCNAGIRTLANESAIAERSAFRAIVGLERKGRIKVTRSRGGWKSDTNNYALIMPKGARTADTESAVPTADNDDMSPLTLCQPNLVELRSEGDAKASPLAVRENEPSVLDSTGSGADARGAPPEPFEERPESHREPEPGVASAISGQAHDARDDGGVHAAWRALVELWSVRPWPMTPREIAIARTLFVKAVADGTPVDPILAGAGAWVSGVDDPRYLKALPQWLQAKGWEHAPPTKPKRQAGQRHARREKTDLASMMYQLGRTM